jgi:hypothetical protein
MRAAALASALLLAALGAPLVAPVAAHAQEEMAACTGPMVPPPPAYAAWNAQAPLTSAVAAAALGAATITPDHAVLAELHPTREVAYVMQPEKPGGAVAKGGIFQIEIAMAGVYRVAIGSGAWLDVLKDGKPLMSVAHGHGPTCSGIRKMVDFPLEPGRYVLQISANADPKIAVLILRQP